jgi:hypothetical protein
MSFFYVNADNSQPNTYLKLSDALYSGKIKNGDTIYIQYDYTEPSKFTIDYGITIIGRTDPTSGDRPTIQIHSNTDEISVLCNASNITIQGVCLSDRSPILCNDLCVCIAKDASGNSTYENIQLLDCKIEYSRYGLLSYAASIVVSGCELYNNLSNSNKITIFSQNNIDTLRDLYPEFTAGNIPLRRGSNPNISISDVPANLNQYQLLWM